MPPHKNPKPAQPDKEKLIRLVKSWQKRADLTIDQVLARMQTRSCDISRATFENYFTSRVELQPRVPPECTLALIAAFIEGLPHRKQCPAAEALELAALTGLPFSYLEPLRHFFDEAEFVEALRRYMPVANAFTLPATGPAPFTKADDTATLSPWSLAAEWGEAPDVSAFQGRTGELDELARWLGPQRCRLVGVFGKGGIGKTMLATKLAQYSSKQYPARFGSILWRSLRNAPPLEETLRECLYFFTGHQDRNLPPAGQAQVTLLLKHFQEQPCLLVLDNLEAILEKQPAGRYRPGYEDYGAWLAQIGTAPHQSCLVVTSRERPHEFALTGAAGPIRALHLTGLTQTEARAILADRGLSGSEADWRELIGGYAGNPQMLQLVVEIIRDSYNGQIAAFLNDGKIAVGDINGLLDWYFERLSPREREIIFWLAIEREAVERETLRTSLVDPAARAAIPETLTFLQRRYLIEAGAAGFTLQNVIMEYTTDRLVDRVSLELSQPPFFRPAENRPATTPAPLFLSHALMKAQAKEYIRQIQVRLILNPIAERLLAGLGQKETEARLFEWVNLLRREASFLPGYAGGNLFNLLVHLNSDLRGRDFSGLALWQADLQNVALPEVNLAQADLTGSAFKHTFESVWAVAFSPDGENVVGGLENGEIYWWRVSDSQQVLARLEHNGYVCSIAFSPDGRLMATNGNDGLVRVWDAQTWECIHRLQGHTSRCREVTFSRDSRWLASAGEDHTIRCWDVVTGQARNVLLGHTDQVASVAIHPQGQYLASSSLDQTVRLWDVNTGQTITFLPGPTKWLKSLAFSPDGRYLAGGGEEGHIYLWTWPELGDPNILAGHTRKITKVAFTPDGSRLASASDDGTISYWDSQSGHCLAVLTGHQGRVITLAFSRDGRWLISSGEDKTMRLWDAQTHHSLKVWQSYTNRVLGLAFSPDGHTLAAAYGDARVQLWDVKNRRPLKTLLGHTDRIWSVAFSPDGRLLASGSIDKTIKIWNLTTFACRHTLTGHTDWVRQLLFTPAGDTLISSSDDKTVRFWRVKTGECFLVLREHTGWVWAAALDPTGHLLATGSADQTVRLWRVDTGECLHTFSGHTGQVWAVAFSPDGKLLASAGQDQTIRFWDLQTYECCQILADQVGRVWSISFTLDGETLVSGGENPTCQVWEVKSGDRRQNFKGHTSLVMSIAPHPGGRILATSSLDVTIRLWDIAGGDCVAVLRPNRPYEGMNIFGATGLTEAQKASLQALGAVERADG